ncbi:hypothetical protein JIX56_43265 [Streptomyces sp. CA-210063]|uniref:hypothetical protein n=1 Tax=Streptomyces sp. CA-210063 TaxID=2801029 RepID=UPI00214B171B|nr:hypothetical protein [Streptomyces sp. CA-210063]UUU37451.1 hypothetical protein JIX56_43265 [Streptomyces sp. CA-210063]
MGHTKRRTRTRTSRTAARPPPLLDEIGRCADETRRTFTDGVLVVMGDIAARLAPDDPPSAREGAQRLRHDGWDIPWPVSAGAEPVGHVRLG